jgi:hypothetical protein
MRSPALLAAVTIAAAASVAFGAYAAVGSITSARAASGGAVPFVARVVRATVANRYRETWTSLDPAQQHLVPRDVYVRCESGSPIPGRLRSLRVLKDGPATVRVPGRGTVAGWAVRLRLVIAAPQLPLAVVVHTFHAIRVNGDWRWYLPAHRLALYGAGCGRPPSSVA